MGKTKQQVKGKKFDRNVEISAPIVDPEVIRAIHSGPKDKKLDIRHGGFKALLSDLNSQDSTDGEPAAGTENHLPSYIGISCAVSGYSNYSSYINRRPPLGELTNGNEARATRASANNSRLSTTPSNRSYTGSPLGRSRNNNDQVQINHVTIDKSNISSPDQERKELTEKLTASVTEKRRDPSPLPPIEYGRHHGAYVGARYFPMPDPSEQVHKHIPLLGIDDDLDPDEIEPDDANKMEKKIANLYGEEFVEDWKESMSHKAKKEHNEELNGQQADSRAANNLKDLVTLKPTPPKAPEPRVEPADVPRPDVQVLAGVEKQFLNRLLTDENPPMPKSPSPQSMSPVMPRYGRPVMSPVSPTLDQRASDGEDVRGSATARDSPVSASSPLRSPTRPSPTPPPQSPPKATSTSPVGGAYQPERVEQESPTSLPLPVPQPVQQSPKSPSPGPESPRDSPISQRDTTDSAQAQMADEQVVVDEIIRLDEQHNATLDEPHILAGDDFDTERHQMSPDSVESSSTVEEVRSGRPAGSEHFEQHIEYEIRTESPVDNESSPVKVMAGGTMEHLDDAQRPATNAPEVADLVSFSPEPGEANNNNQSAAAKEAADHMDLIKMQEDKQSAEVGSPPLQADDLRQVSEASPATELPGASESADDVVRDGRYFLSILEQEESFIMDQARLAEAKLAEHESEWSEETIGKVRSAIGKAHLLVNKKCNQFRQLCEKSLANDAGDQYAVLNDDLAGFWDMISIQIADVRRSFESL